MFTPVGDLTDSSWVVCGRECEAIDRGEKKNLKGNNGTRGVSLLKPRGSDDMFHQVPPHLNVVCALANHITRAFNTLYCFLQLQRLAFLRMFCFTVIQMFIATVPVTHR